MRLLNVKTLEFAVFTHGTRPKYAILSHRWVAGFEATIKDIKKRRNMDGLGWKKVKYAKKHLPVDWIWVDTCCINQENAAELSEAVILMFEWYRTAEICVAYLQDVKAVDDDASFEQSEWFRRGWTLQELLAPRIVVFVTKTWEVIGNKGASNHKLTYPGTVVGPGLEDSVARVTQIPEQILNDYSLSMECSIEEKLKWIQGRTTTREEDMWNALHGIFGVVPGANYGGSLAASRHLMSAIRQQQKDLAEQSDRQDKVIDWLVPSNQTSSHEFARDRHEPTTGTWLLESEQYRGWKSGRIKHLWIHGKTGCGKTVLCSTTIEDIREYCRLSPSADQAFFYFSFSEAKKQAYDDLLRSLLVQLGTREPLLSILHQTWINNRPNPPGIGGLEAALQSCIAACQEVYLHLDAIDECSEDSDRRERVLEGLEKLLQNAPNVRILVFSRDIPDVRNCMQKIGVEQMPITVETANNDIRKHISAQISRDRRLSRLDPETRVMVEETFAQKADGMFRWSYYQFQEIKRLTSTKPRSVKAALHTLLPKSLDETYERMLCNIRPEVRGDALTLLRWIAYAQSPLSLGELVDATIINLREEKIEVEDRGGLGDALEILSGLVTAQGGAIDDDSLQSFKARELATAPSFDIDGRSDRPRQRVGRETKIQLAHFSIKEYLESPRMLEGKAKDFSLQSTREHTILAQSCLVYLRHYSRSKEKTSTDDDLEKFPLLEYAARSWSYHSSLQQAGSVIQEVFLLNQHEAKRDWLLIHQPDQPWRKPMHPLTDVGSALYYASFLGLQSVVQALIDAGADHNSQGGYHGNPLQAASHQGHEKVVRILLSAGVEVNVVGARNGTALQAASAGSYSTVMQMLMDAGADGTAAQGSMVEGHGKIFQLLLDNGAIVCPADRDRLGRTLTHIAASYGSCEGVRYAMEKGQEINEVDNQGWTPFHWAAYCARTSVVELLLEEGADHTLRDCQGWTPKQVAAFSGNSAVEKILPDDINSKSPAPGETLRPTCDSCDHYLIRDQHHCTTCPDMPGFDLCFRCIRDVASVHPGHAFTTTFRYDC